MKRQVKDIISVVLVLLAIIAVVGLIGSLATRNNGEEEGTKNEETVKFEDSSQSEEDEIVYCVGSHTLMINRKAVDSGTEYSYVCRECLTELAPSRIIPDKVVALADASTFNDRVNKSWFKKSSLETRLDLINKNNEIYVEFRGTTHSYAEAFSNKELASLPRYAVIKYRSTGNLYFMVNAVTAYGVSSGNKYAFANTSTEWKTAVLDLSGILGDNFVGSEVTLRMLVSSYSSAGSCIDVAYVMLADDIIGLVETDYYNLYHEDYLQEPESKLLLTEDLNVSVPEDTSSDISTNDPVESIDAEETDTDDGSINPSGMDS